MRRSLCLPLAFVVLLGLAVMSRLSADTVILKNGSVFKGKIVEETDEKIVMKMPEGKMTFRKDQIEQIERDTKKPPAPAPPEPEPASPSEPSTPAGGGEAPPPPAPPPPAGKSLDLASIPQTSPITLVVRDQPLEKVLAELA